MELKFEVPIGKILSLLCCALEGGASYWAPQVEEGEPSRDPSAMDGIEDYWHWSQKWPATGGWITITEVDPDTGQGRNHRLDRDRVRSGLRLMAENSPGHFSDFMSGDEDGETGDVFLQYCLFGEIVYG